MTETCVFCGRAIPGKHPTNADRFRAMSDEDLAAWMLKNISCDKETYMCVPEMYKYSGKCNGNCRAGHLAYLRQPAEEVAHA